MAFWDVGLILEELKFRSQNPSLGTLVYMVDVEFGGENPLNVYGLNSQGMAIECEVNALILSLDPTPTSPVYASS